MTTRFYSVAYKPTLSSRWKGLAAYPWYDDPAPAERLSDWLRQVKPENDYAVATIEIGDDNA